jgi:hypothetical protein
VEDILKGHLDINLCEGQQFSECTEKEIHDWDFEMELCLEIRRSHGILNTVE